MNHITIRGNVEFLAGKEGVIELEKQMLNYARGTPDQNDIIVVLEGTNVPILEIRCTETDTVFVSEPDQAGQSGKISVLNGQPFRASVERRPMKGDVPRVLTAFVGHRASFH